jgi:hypothetical protein
MSTDYRALCAELLQLEQEQPAEYTDWKMRYNAAIARARAALAQPEPVAPTDEELLGVAASKIDPYESSGIAIGEYEPETECALEVYGSELIDYARAVLARWGTLANTTSEEN